MDDRGEQLCLAHGGQEEGDVARPGGQLPGHVGAVDVVDTAAVLLHIAVQEALEGAHGQLVGGVGDGDGPLAPGVDIAEHVALPLTPPGAGIGGAQGLHHPLRLHAEDHPVDGLEFQRVIVEVHQLHQGVPGGQIGPLSLRGEPLLPLIALLGGGQGVVAVPHGKEHDRLVPGAVAGVERGRAGQGGQGAGDLDLLILGEFPALNVTAPLHQVEVVQDLHGTGLCGQGLNDRFLRVVHQEHHVRQFHRGIFPHGHSGGDAGEDRPLGGPDGGGGMGLIVVLLQVHHADEAPPHLSAVQRALHIKEGAGVLLKAALPKIAAHGVVDLHDIGLDVGPLQAALRQDHAQGGGGPAHILLHPLPVLRLGGVLIAGHHAPLGVFAVLGQQDVCRAERKGFE